MIQSKTYRSIVTAILSVSAILLSACSPKSEDASQGKKNIVVASYPEYDWLCHILGTKAQAFNVKLLMDDGVDLHSYEPNIQDIAAISDADLFIYNGGSSYKWVDRVMKLKSKEGRQQINLMHALGDKVQVVEGEACSHCCHDESCGHDHHHHNANCEHEQVHDATHEDEHIWLSLRNAIQLCEVIEEAVSQADPAQAEQYEANKQAYIAQLKSLDAQYSDAVSKAQRDTIIIADRFPFIYLLSDYGIKHHAAFQGCSSETEASFETVTQLSSIVKDLSPKVILIVKGGMQKLAQTLILNSKQESCQIMELDDLHTASDRSYLDIMSDNLKVIQAALAP